jgi:hypothetical protein
MPVILTTCSYLGGGQEDHGSRPAMGEKFTRLHLNGENLGWVCSYHPGYSRAGLGKKMRP